MDPKPTDTEETTTEIERVADRQAETEEDLAAETEVGIGDTADHQNDQEGRGQDLDPEVNTPVRKGDMEAILEATAPETVSFSNHFLIFDELEFCCRIF